MTNSSTLGAPCGQERRDPVSVSIHTHLFQELWQPVPFRRKRELIQPVDGARPMRAEARGKLLAAIARGRSWLEEISSDPATRLELIAAREGLPERSARSILSLAFLAPDIVKAAVAGRFRGDSASPG